MYTTVAATELLIRGFGGRFAGAEQPWIHASSSEDGQPHGAWIDFDVVPDRAGPLSSGERAYLLIAASIGSEQVQVNLSDEISRLGREHLDLVLAAIAHAAGSHQHSGLTFDRDGHPTGFTKLPSLYPWPTAPAPQ
ncbi:hypothetical protein ABIB25_000937 [Nakamurella sp. UYEF19]|uniref:hypothetical protein n=1 Tax=Nakamurella sp. UYEF19 TaxID=1756392 RepID=UPI0033961C7D